VRELLKAEAVGDEPLGGVGVGGEFRVGDVLPCLRAWSVVDEWEN
jgi:hypothetical protein